ncbi:glycoside hydrolase family 10 protein [Aquirufa aurantiipilula]
MRGSYLILALFFLMHSLAAQSPKRELRGVWVATVQNIDWPSARNYNSIKQREEFIDLIDSHHQTGMNAIFVQVRCAADALYAKSTEPWSAYLSGFQGQAPSPYYDPLEFMIEQSHERGMEFHAWLNLNRATMSAKTILSSDHLARRHPEWLFSYNGQLILNFGIPQVRHYIAELVKNLIKNYDVDGVHFDDYFYPYPIKGATIPDEKTFQQYKFPEESLADWRRRNVNMLIQEIAETVKSTKPKVKFGISPFGIWRHQSIDQEDGSPTRAGLQSYDDLFADTELWIRKGWVDYLAPQLYWGTTHRVAPYKALATWWSEHSFDRPIYMGHAAYHLSDLWAPAELAKQLSISRSLPKVQGAIYFSSRQISQNTKGWRDSLRTKHFEHIALVPPMLWIDSIAPTAPHQVNLAKQKDQWILRWKEGEPSLDNDPPRYYLVYRIQKDEIEPLDKAENIIYKGSDKQLIIDSKWIKSGTGFVVTALDRLHNESIPGTIQWIVPNVVE